VARLLDLSQPRIYQLIGEGRIPATRLGRRIVIPRRSFDAWLAEHERRALAGVAR